MSWVLFLKRGAVEALELWVVLVAFIEGAGDGHEFDGFAVAGAADVWAGAEIPEVAVLEEGDGLALGDVVEEIDFEFRWLGAFAECGEAAGLCEC